MNVKHFLVAVAVVAMLAAVMASNAAAAAEPGGMWHVEGVEEFEGPESVACEIGEHEGEKRFSLTAYVGTSKVPVTLHATGLECVEATIFNYERSTGTNEGSLVFTGVTITGELGTVCAVENEAVQTNNLIGELYMDSEDPEIAFDRIEPAGERVNFAVIHIVGASCPITGNRPIKGVVFGEGVNATGVQSPVQPLTFSAAIEETAGGHLEFAGNAAELDGQVITYLSGANTGQKFWAE